MKCHPIIESVMADIEGLDFADDEKRQGAEDSIICTVQTLIDRLATSADALASKDAALSEIRAELERVREALATADEAIAEYIRYLDGGEMRGSYDGKPERNQLRKAGYVVRAAARALAEGETK